MATNNNAGKRLQELKHSGYEMADGDPDIRGWDVRDTETTLMGKVDELIFDMQDLKVRYMVVDLNKNVSPEKPDHVLVPIGLVELHNVDNDAMLSGVTQQQLASLPRYHDEIDNNMENKIRSVFAGGGTAAIGYDMMKNKSGEVNDTDFYAHEHFNENNLLKNRGGKNTDNTTAVPIIEENLQVGKETVQTGGVHIQSRIVEKPVEETVTLQEEHVQVERKSVDQPVSNSDFDAFKEGIIELKEYAEVPVISKEARVVEEITIGKDVTERDETIHDTVRKTEVEVESFNSPKHTTSATGSSGDL